MCAAKDIFGLRPLDDTREYALRVLDHAIEKQWPHAVNTAGLGLVRGATVHGQLTAQNMPRMNLVLEGELVQVVMDHAPQAEPWLVRSGPGEAVFFPPFAPYQSRRDTVCMGVGIVWNAGYVRVVTFDRKGGYWALPRSPFAYHTARPIGACGQRLLEAMPLLPADPSGHESRAALGRLLLQETRRHIANDTGQSCFATKAAYTWYLADRFIDVHLHQPLARDQVAHAAGISGPYLSRLCAQQTGRTYQRHVLELRVERAKQLLSNTTMTVQEVAIASGFANARHFNEAFSRVVGKPPGRYRREVVTLPNQAGQPVGSRGATAFGPAPAKSRG